MLRKSRFKEKKCFLIKNTCISVYNYVFFKQDSQYESEIKIKNSIGINNPWVLSN